MCYPRDAMVASHRDPADRLMVRARVRMRVNIIPHRGNFFFAQKLLEPLNFGSTRFGGHESHKQPTDDAGGARGPSLAQPALGPVRRPEQQAYSGHPEPRGLHRRCLGTRCARALDG